MLRRFLSFGDGLPMTVATLLVCGPVLFGLAIIFFEPWRDPSWLVEYMTNPTRHSLFLLYFLLILNGVLTVDDKNGDQRRVARTYLKWLSDVMLSAAFGIIICLTIVVDYKTTATSRENVAFCIAGVLGILSIALGRRDLSERRRFEQAMQSADQ